MSSQHAPHQGITGTDSPYKRGQVGEQVTLLRLHEDKTFDAVDSAKAHADQLAAKLGRDRSAHEILGRFVRVTDEDGEEVYLAPLTNRV
jgi:hypothetical protein